MNIEEFPQLHQYLRDRGYIDSGEVPATRSLSGGVSSRVVLIERESGEAWVIKQALAKLRVAVEWNSSPERMHREALGQVWLEKLTPPGTIAPLIFEDREHHLLMMQAVPQPHDNWKSLLLQGHLAPQHVEQFGVLLGTMHRRAAQQAAELAPLFEDTSFFESLRLEPYYAYSATQAPAAATFLERLIGETRARRYTLVHGDYSPKNILVHHGRLILLDHEVIHWGDPAFDVGVSLTHQLSKAHHLVLHRSAFVEAANQYWRVYCQAIDNQSWGIDLEAFAVRHTLACLLARSVGRSPLEYLNNVERSRQRDTVIALMADTPSSMPELVQRFINEIVKHES
jgi:tRNA A-37 threonylcarbamoyl transferase component Bud32